MNKKGFTLTEVLAVLVLLGLIVLLAFPTVDKYIKNARAEMYETQINNVILSAKEWGVDNKSLLPQDDNGTMNITLGFLIQEGYVEVGINNPKTKKPLPLEMEISITKVGNIYKYEING